MKNVGFDECPIPGREWFSTLGASAALCEDRVLDGPASWGKGSKGGPYKCCHPRTCMNFHRSKARPMVKAAPAADRCGEIFVSFHEESGNDCCTVDP
jgi:hypothetical protein